MKVCVIGAGIAGLLSVKHAKCSGFEVKCYEQTDSIGGTWVYEEGFGMKEYGGIIHTAMYKNLRTNLPKELMGFKDYPNNISDKSFISSSDVMEFIQQFVRDFSLYDNIHLKHQVQKVKPLPNNRWLIVTKNFENQEISQEAFDSVFVCNGHHWLPNVPELNGVEHFKGRMLHSYEYRRPGDFEKLSVLVIGCGMSGREIANDLASKAELVYFSHHSKNSFKDQFSLNVTIKPDVKQVTKTGEIRFVDNSLAKVDVIVFCTGYKYSFPFLSPECGIELDGYHIRKLYKHCINIEYPTMFFIGIVFPTIITFMMDLQVRFCIKLLSTPERMPSKEMMLESYDEELKEAKLNNVPNKKMHEIEFVKMVKYFNELERIAGLEPLAPVIFKLTARVFELIQKEFGRYRRYKFTLIDHDNFTETIE